LGAVLSNAEREFLENLQKGKIDQYNPNYRRVLKFKILKKRKALTDDLLLVNAVLDQLEAL
jgi:hypothetical protein